MADQGKKKTADTKKTIQKEKPTEKVVKFILSAPEANQVYLAGDFNNWDNHALPLKRNRENQWEADVQLPPGRYEYKYFVDGKWFDNIPGVERIQNSYGTQNFIIHIN